MAIQKKKGQHHIKEFPIVGIGASAGGLDAFKRFLKNIPAKSGMAYVIVQHMDPTHPSNLPELLSKVTTVPVKEITDKIHIKPDCIFVIPPNKILTAPDGILKLSRRTSKMKELPIDHFFKSLGEAHKSFAIGIILSGSGNDGTLGLQMIKENGGITFAQDLKSAAFEHMPKNAINAGVADFILPPEKIPKQLVQIKFSYKKLRENEKELSKTEEEIFRQIILLVLQRTGIDFTNYKRPTLYRRIERRMSINKLTALGEYLIFLEENKTEQDLLFQDFLIHVTSFFRDTKTFQEIGDGILPLILKKRPAHEPIRIWVAGCATGEEAYSLAICLHELFSELDKNVAYGNSKVQIFASDISEIAVKKARAGIYTRAEVSAVSDERLKNYFIKKSGGYQVVDFIRGMCVFAPHNFLKDPPFAKMDLISCRNVLIYMDSFLQKKVLATFHYALKEKGFLLLGKSETANAAPDLFTPFTKHNKIYLRKSVPGHFMHVVTPRDEQALEIRSKNQMKPEVQISDFRKSAEQTLLAKYTPVSVVVNDQMNIVHIHGTITPFLQPPAGKPTFHLLKMAREELSFELRNALHKAKTTLDTVVKENIPVTIDRKKKLVTIEIVPLNDTSDPHYLIIFTSNNSKEETGKTTGNSNAEKPQSRIIELEKQLAQAREDMRSISEDQESANEELQSTNEELQSSNEEMQSLNEELETAKEELQATNEELVTVNQDLIEKQEHLDAARLYAEAIVNSVNDPLLVLDSELRIKSGNAAFYKKFELAENEIANKLFYEIQNYRWNNTLLRKELENVVSGQLQLNDYEVLLDLPLIGKRTMLLNSQQVSGENIEEQLILLSIEDITEKKATKKLKESEAYYRQLIQGLPIAVYTCDADGYLRLYNEAAVELWGRAPVIGTERWCGSWKMYNRDGSPLTLDNCPMAIALKEARITHPEIIIERPDGERRYIIPYPQPVYDIDGKLNGAINTLIDITAHVEAHKKVEEAETRTRLAMDAAEMGSFDWDIQNQKFYSAPRVLSIFGFADQPHTSHHDLINSFHPDDKPKRDKAVADAPFKGSLVYEARIIWKDQSIHWVKVYGKVVFDEKNTPVRMYGMVTDITEQKEIEDELARSAKRFQLLSDTMPQLVWTGDAQGNLNYFNSAVFDYSGVDDAAVQNNGWLNIVHPDDRVENINKWTNAVATGKNFYFEHRFRRHDNSYRWHLSRAVPQIDQHGNILMWIGTSTDIHDFRNFAEELEKKVKSRTKQLTKQNEFVQTLLDSSVDMIIVVDKDLRFISLNKTAESIFSEFIAESIVGKTMEEVDPKTKEKQGYADVIAALKGEHIHRKEVKSNVVDKYYDLHYVPLKNESEVYAVMIITREVTESVNTSRQLMQLNQELANQKAFAELLIESNPSMVMVYDRDMRIITWNKSSADHFNLKKEDVLGRNVLDVFPEYNNENWINSSNEVLLLGKSLHHSKIKFRYKPGWGESFVIPLRDSDGEIIGALALTRDITELVNMTSDIEKKNEDLEKMNKELTSFSYIASHDLQEPLRKIITFSNRLQEKYKSQLSGDVGNYLDKIENSSRRMTKLIQDLLNYSRLINHEKMFEQTDLNDVLKNVLADFELLIEEKNAEIKSGMLPVIEAVPLQMGQLFYNLISNALKFSKQEVAPLINISSRKLLRQEIVKNTLLNNENEYFEICFTDNGIGFDQKYREQIFLIFQRLHPKNEYTGTGIGLALSKKIVEDHHGVVFCEASENLGAKFYIILPAKQISS